MALDASLVARQVGVTAQYQDARSGTAKRLPQRIYVIASGETGASFSTTKFRALSAAQVGQTAGWKSQAFHVARQLFPRNGDGVGQIPVTFALLADDESGVAAAGDITPSGTATSAGSYRVNVSGILSDPFVIPAGAVSVTNTCVSIGEAINATLGMPGTATYTYGSATSAKTVTVGTSNGTMGSVTVNSTLQPRPGVYVLVCTATATNAGTFSVTAPDGTSLPALTVASAYNSGTGLTFTLADGSNDFAVGDTFEITVPVSKVTFTCGWAGTTGNDLDLRIDGPSLGVEFAFTQPTGGLVDPSPDDALAQIGNIWETLVLNGLHISNSVALDSYKEWGEGRWSPVVKKPALVFTGARVTTPASAIVVTDSRKDDRINVQLVAPGSRTLPCAIAARQVARIAVMANTTPPHDYTLLKADGIEPGIDSAQWDLTARDYIVKGGSSTAEAIDNVVRISDVVTMWHPTGEDPPAYRYVVDVIKLQNVVYNVDQHFSGEDWAGAPLVGDDDPTTEPTAKKPKMAKADMAMILDGLGLAAIIADVANSKKQISAGINGENSKRLDIAAPIKLSSNSNIIDTTLYWSFFYG